MNKYLLLFRQPDYDYSIAYPEKMQALGRRWQDWVGDIAAQQKFVNHGPRLAREGKVLKAGGLITDGPFIEVREKLEGFIVVKADSLEDAAALAQGCPALDEGGSVEIRPVYLQ